MAFLRQAGIGLLSGFIAGLVLGVGARLAMRGVAMSAHQAGGFSLEGTLLILAIGVIVGLATGPIFMALRRYLPGHGRWPGLVFGVLVFLVLLLFLPPPIKAEIAQSGGPLPLIIALFAAAFAVYGIVLHAIVARFSLPSSLPR